MRFLLCNNQWEMSNVLQSNNISCMHSKSLSQYVCLHLMFVPCFLENVCDEILRYNGLLLFRVLLFIINY